MAISRRDLLVASLAAALPFNVAANPSYTRQAAQLKGLVKRASFSRIDNLGYGCSNGAVWTATKNRVSVHFSEDEPFTAIYVPRGGSFTAAWDLGSNGSADRVALYQVKGHQDIGWSKKMELNVIGYCGLPAQNDSQHTLREISDNGTLFKSFHIYEANGNLANLISGEFKQLDPADTRKVMQQVYGHCLDQALNAFR